METASHEIEKGWIAYTSNRAGSYDIWLFQMNGGINSRLTDGLGMEFSIPYWSPDNNKIAFIGVNKVVFVLDIGTRAISRIDQIEPYSLLDWSPDSRSLVYVKNGRIMIYDTLSHRSYFIPEADASDVQWFPSGQEFLFAAPDIHGNTQIYRIRTDGSNRRQITRNTEGPFHQLRISPNGKFALYTFPGASISLISVVNLETGATNTLEGAPFLKIIILRGHLIHKTSLTAPPNLGIQHMIRSSRLTASWAAIKRPLRYPIVLPHQWTGLRMATKSHTYRVVPLLKVLVSFGLWISVSRGR